jgi:hypothetical protein
MIMSGIFVGWLLLDFSNVRFRDFAGNFGNPEAGDLLRTPETEVQRAEFEEKPRNLNQ